MEFSRYEAKMRAKASMRGAYPHPALVTLVYVLMTTVLSMVVQALVVNPFARYFEYVAAGYDPVEVFTRLSAAAAGGGVLFILLNIILSLYTVIVGFGYTSYSLRLARNEQPGYRNLLDGFSSMGRVLLMYILEFVFIFLWGLAALVPYFVVMVMAILFESALLAVVAAILYILGLIFMVSVTYRYSLAPYFLLDNPGMGALDSLTASKNAMKGWKWKLFVLELSFLGWMILSCFTLGILSLWVTPYMNATIANFYDFVVHGGYSSPDFRSSPGMPNGPSQPGPEF